MSCAEFESELARLLAGTTPDDGLLSDVERERMLDRLRGHARRCEACAAAMDLIDLAALPAAERDWVEDPGRAYWKEFHPRVARQIAATPAAAPGWRRWAAVAAVFALVAVLFVVATTRRKPTSATGPRSGEVTTELAEPLPVSLDRMLEEAPDVELLEELDFLAGLDDASVATDGEGGWLFPDTRDLDPEMRDDLLLWLQEQNADTRGVSS